MTIAGEQAQDGAARHELRELLLQPIKSYNPFEETLARLARAIRLGIIAKGEKFPSERELSETLGVSRTTVREAIRGLEQAGYVTTERGRFGGTTVLRQHAAPSSRERRALLGPDLPGILDLRLVVEPGVAALAAERASAEEVAQMRASLEDSETTSEGDYPRANCRFHILIAKATGSEPVVQTMTDIEMRVLDVFLVTPRLETSVEHSGEQHREIIDAIGAGDADSALEAMSKHVRASDIILRELIS